MADLCFEEIEIGSSSSVGEYAVSEAEILEFGRRFDPRPFHCDPVAAASSAFGGLVATRWLGGVLVAGGALVFVDFASRFVWEGHGTPAPVAPTRHLVVNGPFRFCRNPGYVAVVAMLVGQALVLASGRLLLYAAAVGAAFHLFVLHYEEPALRRTFGVGTGRTPRSPAGAPKWPPHAPTPAGFLRWSGCRPGHPGAQRGTLRPRHLSMDFLEKSHLPSCSSAGMRRSAAIAATVFSSMARYRAASFTSIVSFGSTDISSHISSRRGPRACISARGHPRSRPTPSFRFATVSTWLQQRALRQ